jgi:hypothetical protein
VYGLKKRLGYLILTDSHFQVPAVHRKIATPFAPAALAVANIFWPLGLILIHTRGLTQQSLYIANWQVDIVCILA